MTVTADLLAGMASTPLLSAGDCPAPGGRSAMGGNGRVMTKNAQVRQLFSVECTSYATPATAGTVRGSLPNLGKQVQRDQPYMCVLPRPGAGGEVLMPHKDPEARREWQRNYRAANSEQINADNRARRAASPEGPRAAEKRWRDANPEKVAARGAAYYEANGEKVRDRSRDNYAANRDKRREQGRVSHLWRHHGMTPADFAEMWRSQEGLCYLCSRPLPDNPRHVHIDHDHSCCPPGYSCAACRRGLACQACNKAIGLFADDPDLLERAAAALRIAKAQAQPRIAGMPVQEELALDVARSERRGRAGL